MHSRSEFKNNIKVYRQRENLTQTQLAQMVGVSKNTISSIETARFSPSAYLAASLCIVFKCEFKDLFYIAGN